MKIEKLALVRVFTQSAQLGQIKYLNLASIFSDTHEEWFLPSGIICEPQSKYQPCLSESNQ